MNSSARPKRPAISQGWFLRRLLPLGLALGLNGCAGYQLGPTNGQVAGARSVQVNPFLNQTMQPQLGDDVTNQVRKQIQRNHRLEFPST